MIPDSSIEVFVNKTELIDYIAADADISKVLAARALDSTIEAIKVSLKKGQSVSLVGFGTFSVSTRAARTGINPSTKQAIKIGAKKVAKFKAGAELSAAIK